MLITSKPTSSPSVVTNSDELIISIPLIIPGIKTHHHHEYSMSVCPTTNNPILEPRILSPRYSKTGVVTGGGTGGVGLGIVAALDNFEGRKPAVTKFTGGGADNSLNTNRSNPIAIGVSSTNKYSTNTKTKPSEGLGSVEMSTSTTAAAAGGGASGSVRSMYCDGGIEDERNHRLNKWRQVGVFYESPSPIFYNTSGVTRDNRPSDFLSSCHLCRKKLHGKDIYMYRGEKAFCSTECRYQQIATDERKDKKRPRRRNDVSRSSFDVSSSAGASPYLDDHLFSPGIMAI